MKANILQILRYLLVTLILVGCVYILRPGFTKYRAQRSEVKRMELEVKKLEAERARLEEQMQTLEDQDPEYIEKLAREKLHLSKPGETVFRFKKKH